MNHSDTELISMMESLTDKERLTSDKLRILDNLSKDESVRLLELIAQNKKTEKKEELRTPREWGLIIEKANAKQKYRQMLTYLMNRLIPDLEELTVYAGHEEEPREIRQRIDTKLADVNRELKNFIVELVSN